MVLNVSLQEGAQWAAACGYPVRPVLRRWRLHVKDTSLRGIADRDHRQEAGRGHSVAHVLYADGEKMSTEVVQAVLHRLGARVTHFDDVSGCLDFLRVCECHLLISNARQPAKEGVILLREAKRIVPSVPVFMMVDQGDIQTAVRAMKDGAVDCLERMPEQKHLLVALSAALHALSQNAPPPRVSLSQTEKQVLQLILQGLTTAEAARTLHRSGRTIEVHRSHIMRKLDVDSTVGLVRKCARLGFLENWP